MCVVNVDVLGLKKSDSRRESTIIISKEVGWKAILWDIGLKMQEEIDGFMVPTKKK